MKTHFPLCFFILLVAGCANTLSQTPPGEPILAHPVPKPVLSTSPFEKTAWQHFRKTDYVRALKFAYQAAENQPDNPSSALLIGLIYDQGFQRPDLALGAYHHLLQNASQYQTIQILQPRLQHLFRLTQQRVAQIALHHPKIKPLEGQDLVIFPFQAWGTNKTDAAFALGLTDILLSDLLPESDAQQALQIQIIARTFQQTISDTDAATFAQWAGANLTLSGTLVRQNNHKLTITMRLYDATGQIVHLFSPITGQLNNMPDLQNNLIDAIVSATQQAQSPPVTPISSSLALTLHGRALDAYLSGDLEQALEHFAAAEQLSPDTPLFANRYTWAKADSEGIQVSQHLDTLYRSLRHLPNPNDAAERRVRATQMLIAQPSDLDEEPLSPFKSPQPENVP